MEDTIAAISTALGVGAISIIRVSGKEAIEIVNKIWSGKDLSTVPSHTIHYGFIKDGEEKIIGNMNGILIYYIKRIIRLLIPYYIILIITTWLTDSFEHLPGNLAFTQSTGHFWFLQQEVLFCLIFPIIAWSVSFFKRALKFNNLWIFFVLFLCSLLSRKYLSTDIFFLNGNGKKLQFELFIFLIGMSFGYLYKWWKYSCNEKIIFKPIINITCVLTLMFMFLSSEFFLSKLDNSFSGYFIGWEKPLLCALIAGLLLMLILIYPNCIINKILKCPILVYLGKISYTIYLVHYSMLHYVAPLSTNNKKFFAVYILSAGVAALMYKYIEQPCKKISKRITKF